MADPRAATSSSVWLIAGELSGDLLGAALIDALHARRPELPIAGVVGPRMRQRDCRSLASIDALSVMGLAEVVPALPRILALRQKLIDRALAERPALVIGIDAPDFNLGLERRLREAGIRTMHIVSPTVWAWRAGRVNKIARAVERILCLFPFEPPYYERVGLSAEFIGHPLADELDNRVTAPDARQALGLDPERRCVALLPGSRKSEVELLLPDFVAAAERLAHRDASIQFVIPAARPDLHAKIEDLLARHASALPVRLLNGQSREAMQAADAVMLASGTATLECLLLGRPMVVAYRVTGTTALLLRGLGMLKTEYVSLPNLLTAQARVTELLQENVTPEKLADSVWRLLDDPVAAAAQLEQFDAVRRTLRRDAAVRAAEVVLRALEPRR